MNAVTKAVAVRPPSAVGLVPTNMSEAVHLAEWMAASKSMPEHLRGSPGDCLVVIEQAMRWAMSPYAVAQCSGLVKGKLAYEGKLVAAAVQSIGAIEGYFDYEFTGEGETRAVRVWATRAGETEPRELTVRLVDARTANEHWKAGPGKAGPDQMLIYSSTRTWARRWTPGAMLGVYSPDEFEVAQPSSAFDGSTIEGEIAHPDAHTDNGRHSRGANGDAPDIEAPIFTIIRKEGPRTFTTAAEWVEHWLKLIDWYKCADGLDRLKYLRDQNTAALNQARHFDPISVGKVEVAIAEVLGREPYQEEVPS